MKNGWKFLAGLGLAALSACSSLPVSLPPSTQLPTSDHLATLPPGYEKVCDAALCERMGENIIHLNDKIINLLISINTKVNNQITVAKDIGDKKYWSPGEIGDCKTYSVEKVKELIAAGVSRNAMHLAIVRTPQGEGHAVLTIDTNLGTYELDNLHSGVTPWNAWGYTLWTREGLAGEWVFGPVI